MSVIHSDVPVNHSLLVSLVRMMPSIYVPEIPLSFRRFQYIFGKHSRNMSLGYVLVCKSQLYALSAYDWLRGESHWISYLPRSIWE